MKIWNKLFYCIYLILIHLVFWNADKRQYQLTLAKKVANFIFKGEDNKSELIDNYEEWIFSFIDEFMRKFGTVDFLRMDKYLMFSDQILSTFFVACVNKKKYDSINNLLNHLSFEIKNNNYNFTFEANNLRIVARFIEYVFNKENEDNKNVQYFIQNCFLSFFDTILSLLYDVKDKRENKIFEEVLIIAIAKGLQKKKNEKIENKVKERAEEFLKKNEKNMITQKVKILTFLIKKIENENYTGEDLQVKKESVDPVHDYMLSKNYTAKFRKSPLEKKKEKIEAQKQKKKEKKEEQKKEPSKPKEEKEEDNKVQEEIVKITEDDEALVEDNDDDDDDNEDDDDIDIDIDEDNDDDYEDEYEEEIEEDDEDEDGEEDNNEKEAFENTIKNQNLLKQNTAKNYGNFLGKKTKEKSNHQNAPNKKRKVKYALENNVTNVYDRKMPILLTSKKKDVLPPKGSNSKKSLLKKKK